MKVLIKLGGTLLESRDSRNSIAAQLAEISRNHRLVVVHGGGKQVTAYLAERGIESRWVNGLRVSDGAVIDAVTKVISGSINQELVAALVSAGADAVGISGVDGPLTFAERLDDKLGNVGRPIQTDPRLLNVLSENGYVPTVACVAGDRCGEIYNVNADQMAVSCASDWGASQLVFLTDVPGVRGAAGSVLNEVCITDIQNLIRDGVATGGMQAKLEAAESAVLRGVSRVVIASGREANVCRRILAGDRVGTVISSAREAA